MNLAPRRTVRLRLTLVYGALFLVSGAALLGITYALVSHATGNSMCVTTQTTTKGTSTFACHTDAPNFPPPGTVANGRIVTVGGTPVPALTPEQLALQAQQLKVQASRQRAAQMRALLEQSGIALALMAIVSIVLGWIVAGRVLRPLRTITSTAHRLSASNLHERLALDGPDDELKELGDTFDGLLERLEAAFRSQRQFVANASHELRTPLARQRALIQVALADPDATAETLRDTHERVLVATTQQQRCIDALLALSRGQLGVQRQEHIDLAAACDEIVLAHAGDAARRDVAVRTALAPAPIRGDARLIERMLANVLDNAVRYNSAGGRVDITTGVRDGRAIFTIANTGPVVPRDAVPLLLQPFRRLGTERTERGDGLGLGLSIVKAIADAHQATLSLRPRLGGGVAVEIAIPLAATLHSGIPLELDAATY
jgi:signal transduction histidine kinase